jgi:hypothetical protein
MKFFNSIAVALMLLLAGVGLVPAAQAQSTFERITHVTFSAPVQIPGRVLPAGEYVFQLDILPSNETSIVEIRDKNGEKTLATLLTSPDYRLTPTGKTVILFRERPGNAPAALRAWFYPGENFGHEFAYPMREATQLAAANHMNVPAVADNTSDNDLKGAQVTQATGNNNSSQNESADATPAPAPAPAPANNSAANQQQSQPAPQTTAQNDNNLVASNHPLPKTASPIFQIALLGGLFLAAGLMLGFFVGGHSREERGL